MRVVELTGESDAGTFRWVGVRHDGDELFGVETFALLNSTELDEGGTATVLVFVATMLLLAGPACCNALLPVAWRDTRCITYDGNDSPLKGACMDDDLGCMLSPCVAANEMDPLGSLVCTKQHSQKRLGCIYSLFCKPSCLSSAFRVSTCAISSGATTRASGWLSVDRGCLGNADPLQPQSITPPCSATATLEHGFIPQSPNEKPAMEKSTARIAVDRRNASCHRHTGSTQKMMRSSSIVQSLVHDEDVRRNESRGFWVSRSKRNKRVQQTLRNWSDFRTNTSFPKFKRRLSSSLSVAEKDVLKAGYDRLE